MPARADAGDTLAQSLPIGCVDAAAPAQPTDASEAAAPLVHIETTDAPAPFLHIEPSDTPAPLLHIEASHAPAPSIQTAVDSAVAAALAAMAQGSQVVVALSGGRDSVVLLDAAARAARGCAERLHAVHVHHGLSPNADAWAAFCRDLCAQREIPLEVARVKVPRKTRTSTEASARDARYAVLARSAKALGACTVLLAHHQDDQAETLLLQLLRGAGPVGLAAMPAARIDSDGIVWLRPLLGLPGAALAQHACAHALNHIEDESNADPRFLRNALRREVTPRLAALCAGYPATVARAASLQADAAYLLDELAQIDAKKACDGTSIARAALQDLSLPRARNLLRWFLRAQAFPTPSAARLDAMLTQLRTARADARVRLVHAGREIGMHRGRIVVHARTVAPYHCAWCGEAALALPHGTLHFEASRGVGIATARLREGPVSVRSRRGGERLQIDPARPRRALKLLLQEMQIAPWERAQLPLLFCGDHLVAVPGVGIDPAFRARPDAPSLLLQWHARATT